MLSKHYIAPLLICKKFFFLLNLTHSVNNMFIRARLHETQSELKPVWNLKPLWNLVLFTWQFTWKFHCRNFPNNSKALLHMYLLINVNLTEVKFAPKWVSLRPSHNEVTSHQTEILPQSEISNRFELTSGLM